MLIESPKTSSCFNYLLLAIFLLSTGFSEPVRNKVRKTYTAELGVQEATGKNDGVRVETYLKYCYLAKGNPWCAAFVCWSLGQNKVTNPRNGYSPVLFPASKVIYKRTRDINQLPRPGDVFGLYFPEKGRVAHVGFVDSWTNDKWVVTVEGNTNDAGSREGDGVYRKRRLRSSIYIVSDYIR